jgi:DNA-binding protein H-NS
VNEKWRGFCLASFTFVMKGSTRTDKAGFNMADIDLNSMSLKDLKSLQSKLAKAIDDYDSRTRRDAMSALEELAKQKGFSLADLVGPGADSRKRAPVAAKYRNPNGGNETWSGRGRKPMWFATALKSGKVPEDMLI